MCPIINKKRPEISIINEDIESQISIDNNDMENSSNTLPNDDIPSDSSLPIEDSTGEETDIVYLYISDMDTMLTLGEMYDESMGEETEMKEDKEKIEIEEEGEDTAIGEEGIGIEIEEGEEGGDTAIGEEGIGIEIEIEKEEGDAAIGEEGIEIEKEEKDTAIGEVGIEIEKEDGAIEGIEIEEEDAAIGEENNEIIQLAILSYYYKLHQYMSNPTWPNIIMAIIYIRYHYLQFMFSDMLTTVTLAGIYNQVKTMYKEPDTIPSDIIIKYTDKMYQEEIRELDHLTFEQIFEHLFNLLNDYRQRRGCNNGSNKNNHTLLSLPLERGTEITNSIISDYVQQFSRPITALSGMMIKLYVIDLKTSQVSIYNNESSSPHVSIENLYLFISNCIDESVIPDDCRVDIHNNTMTISIIFNINEY